ncbi:MAG: hypothetical protein FJY29_03470 [Betaproteobacteria bacterium]|nr:hypothetical protein [Betaproteobacteria bacterium]
MKRRVNLVIAAGTAAIFGAVGCTGERMFIESGVASPASSSAAAAHNKATTAVGGKPGASSDAVASMGKSTISDQTRVDTRSLVGEKFRVKDSELLRGTLSCVGDNVAALLTVPADAIRSNPQGAQAAPSPGKARVLPFNSVAVGANIIDAKKGDLFDPSAEGRESAASPEATATYLNAATLVAEIVAHNSDVSAATSKAYCRTPEAARALMMRCVPAMGQAQLSIVVDGKTIPERMAAECDKGATADEKNLNSRVALASFLGSWLFLKSER